MKLIAADGWQETTPRPCPWNFAVYDGQSLSLLSASGKTLAATHWSGLRDSPLVLLPGTRTALGYCCNNKLGKKDYSQLTSWDLDTGQRRVWKQLGLNQWITGLLATDGKQALAAMLVTDVPGEQVHIRHQLAVWNSKSGKGRIIPLVRDSIAPLAVSMARRQILFQGGEGISIVGIDGRRQLHFPSHPDNFPRGRGGCFHPLRKQALVGGDGIFLIDEPSQRLTRVAHTGHFPAWDSTGAGFWYSETSADLRHFDMEKQEHQLIIQASENNYPELLYARPLFLSPDQRYILAQFTRAYLPKSNLPEQMAKMGFTADAFVQASDLKRERALIFVDTDKQEFWQLDNGADQLVFVKA